MNKFVYSKMTGSEGSEAGALPQDEVAWPALCWAVRPASCPCSLPPYSSASLAVL